MNKKNTRIGILIVIFGIACVFLMSQESTRPYGWFLFGGLFVMSSVIVLIQRIIFDLSPKESVPGTLFRLELDTSSEGEAYTPCFEYEYHGTVHTYKSSFSAFWYKKSKRIGERIEIMVQTNRPTMVRIKNPGHTAMEYAVVAMMLGIGLYMILYGIRLL